MKTFAKSYLASTVKIFLVRVHRDMAGRVLKSESQIVIRLPCLLFIEGSTAIVVLGNEYFWSLTPL